MIVDFRLARNSLKGVVLYASGLIEERTLVPPYFYVIAPRGLDIEKVARLVGATGIETNKKAVVFTQNGYRVDTTLTVWKVVAETPAQIPQIKTELERLLMGKARFSGFNIRYIVRNTWDLDVEFFGSKPLYIGLDQRVMENVQRLRVLVIDVEKTRDGRIYVGMASLVLGEEFNSQSYKLYEFSKEKDEIEKELDRHVIIIGHNVKGFDLPVIERAGVIINREEKLIFDTSEFLVTWANSVGVGSARSLYDVARVVRDEAGITEEELRIKKEGEGRVDNMSLDELENYNLNDVRLTFKIAKLFFPFVAAVSAMTQIPFSEVVRLPAGLIAEYFLFRFMELNGYVPEYRPIGVELSGEKVWLEKEKLTDGPVAQIDVKMMYPSWVLAHKVDPAWFCGGSRPLYKFCENHEPGFVYALVKRLAEARKITKTLKKRSPAYEPMDKGVKAILNALAYGTMAKQSGEAIMGNPWTPSNIFYGTLHAQYSTIEELRRQGWRVVYSDTDSFYVVLKCKSLEDCEKAARRALEAVNKALIKWGLEADLEAVWRRIQIYSKKNYILIGFDGSVTIKGSALRNLANKWLPEAVKLEELLKTDDTNERLRLLKDMIETASLDDLFIRGHRQFWQLIGKHPQDLKRVPKERQRNYARVLTPWEEPSTIVLKKQRGAQWLMPAEAPLIKLLIEKNNVLLLEDENPLEIVETRVLRIDGPLAKLRGYYTVWDALLLTEDHEVVTINVKEVYYVVVSGEQKMRLPGWYTGIFPQRPIGVIESVEGEIVTKRVPIDEELLRKFVFLYTKQKLKEYGLL